MLCGEKTPKGCGAARTGEKRSAGGDASGAAEEKKLRRHGPQRRGVPFAAVGGRGGSVMVEEVAASRETRQRSAF